MNANQPDIEQIRKYLNGELDVRAMHQLEKQAHSDPFLMDALEGYALAGEAGQEGIDELKRRLADRIASNGNKTILLWRFVQVAAAIVVVGGLGWLWLSPKPVSRSIDKVAGTVKKAPPPQMVVTQQATKTAIAPKTEVGVAENPDHNGNTNEVIRTHHQKVRGNRHLPVEADKPVLAGTVAGVIRTDSTKPQPALAEVLATRAQSLDITETTPKAQFLKQENNETRTVITGMVTDTAGRPIPGANIMVRGAHTNVATDAYGKFSVPVTRDKDTITVRQIGYLAKQLPVAVGQDKLNIKLQENSATLAEVVVVHKMRPADAQPKIGWKDYKAYLHRYAVMPGGESGKVKLSFLIDMAGRITNIRILRGHNEQMNQRAIELVKNGPQWYGDTTSKSKVITLKIKFRKA